MTDLTKGSPLKVIVRFAIPIYIGQLFHLAYGLIDTRIVGSILGARELAAVGSVSTLNDLLLFFINGFTNGFGIIIATFFGAKDEKRMKNAIAWTAVLGFSVALACSTIFLPLLGPVMRLLNVEEDLFALSRSYAFIIIAGLSATAAYNICASVLRSVGDSVTPLVFLIISNVVNGFLDYLLVSKTTLGISGAAYATVISQILSALACFVYMQKKHPGLKLSRDDFTFVPDIFRELMSSGFSMSVMVSFVQFGTVALQTSINTFGQNIIVAHVAARKIGQIVMTPFFVFGTALATYCGQNLGAGLKDRIKKGMKSSFLACCGWWVFAFSMVLLFAPVFIRALTATTDAEIINTARTYLYVNGSLYLLVAGISILRNSMQGFGDRRTPLVSSFIELAGKVIVAMLFAPKLGYWAIILCEPAVWILMIIPLIVRMFGKNRKF